MSFGHQPRPWTVQRSGGHHPLWDDLSLMSTSNCCMLGAQRRLYWRTFISDAWFFRGGPLTFPYYFIRSFPARGGAPGDCDHTLVITNHQKINVHMLLIYFMAGSEAPVTGSVSLTIWKKLMFSFYYLVFQPLPSTKIKQLPSLVNCSSFLSVKTRINM